MAIDRVQPQKLEGTDTGGTETDAFPTAMDRNEDYADVRGVAIQNDTSNDSDVIVSRDSSNNLTFKDANTTVKTLANLSAKVDGPASSTDNAIARFDSTTGKVIQNSLVTVSDAGSVIASNVEVSSETVLGAPSSVGAANSEGSSVYLSRKDHIHNHGALGGGDRHEVVTQSVNGFMSAADKVKIDNVISNGSGDDWCSGLEVTAHSPNNQTVAYTSGTYMVNGVLYSIATGGDYNLQSGFGGVNHYASLTASQRAIVLIYVDSAQVIKSIMGTPTSSYHPVKPEIPGDTVGIAYIEISKTCTNTAKVITASNITDIRQARQPTNDELTKINATDTTSGFLRDKLTDNGNVHFTVENADANESLKADVQFGTSATTACVGNDSRLSEDKTASGLRSATTVVAVSSASAPSAGQVLTATANNAANWQTPSASGAVSVSQVTNTNTHTSSSGTYALLDSQTATPGAGNYMVWFSTNVSHSASNGIVYISIFSNGVQIVESERKLVLTDQKQQGQVVPLETHTYISGLGADQAIEVKWKTSGATASCYNKTLMIAKV
jgi:hypothetical protein